MEDLVKRLTKKEKILFIILCSLVMITFTYKKLIVRNKIKYDLVKKDINKLEKEIHRINNFKKGDYSFGYGEELEFDYKNINLEKLFKIINLSESDFFILDSLEIIEDGYLESNENIKKNIIYMEVSGNEEKIIRFIDDIEKNLELIEVESISIKSIKDGLKLDMIIYLYEINYDFKYKYERNKNENKDPFSKVDLGLEEDSLSTDFLQDAESFNDNKDLKEFKEYKNENKERINFEYIDLQDDINYNSIINSVSLKSKGVNVELFNSKILNENILECRYNIEDKEKSNLIGLNIVDDKVRIDRNSKISFLSEKNNKLSVEIVLSNGSLTKRYYSEIQTNKDWIEFEFKLEEEGYYLSQIIFDLSYSKDNGVINVKIE